MEIVFRNTSSKLVDVTFIFNSRINLQKSIDAGVNHTFTLGTILSHVSYTVKIDGVSHGTFNAYRNGGPNVLEYDGTVLTSV